MAFLCEVDFPHLLLWGRSAEVPALDRCCRQEVDYGLCCRPQVVHSERLESKRRTVVLAGIKGSRVLEAGEIKLLAMHLTSLAHERPLTRQLLSDLCVASVVDLSPGSGSLAIASMSSEDTASRVPIVLLQIEQVAAVFFFRRLRCTTWDSRTAMATRASSPTYATAPR